MPVPAWQPSTVAGETPLAIGRIGSGPDPIVAVHGITVHHRAFNAIAANLRHPDGVVGVDLRGRGESGKPPSGYGLETHAADVLRVLDQGGLDNVVLAGHSMGAFVSVQTALLAPGRIRAIALLDGGWPRREEGGYAPDAAEGIARTMSRLTMTFPTRDAYLDFWFPGQGLTFDTIAPELADYYDYELAPVEGGFRPKASLGAVQEDAEWIASKSPSAEAMAAVACPVALVRAEYGFMPGTTPLIDDAAHDAMVDALDVRVDLLLAGADHYTMLWGHHAIAVASVIDELVAFA